MDRCLSQGKAALILMPIIWATKTSLNNSSLNFHWAQLKVNFRIKDLPDPLANSSSRSTTLVTKLHSILSQTNSNILRHRFLLHPSSSHLKCRITSLLQPINLMLNSTIRHLRHFKILIKSILIIIRISNVSGKAFVRLMNGITN